MSSPESGHLFLFSVTCRGSYSIVGDPRHYESLEHGEPWRVDVRAWSLSEACARAALQPLGDWEPGWERNGFRRPMEPGEVLVFDEPSHRCSLEARRRFYQCGEVMERWESHDGECIWKPTMNVPLDWDIRWPEIVSRCVQYGWSLHVLAPGMSDE